MPVVNNVVAIVTLGVVPGGARANCRCNPVEMGNTKLLVLGIRTSLGVAAQTAVLLVVITRERNQLAPAVGIDHR